MPVLDSNLLIRLDVGDPVATAALESIVESPLVVPYDSALEYAVGTDDAEEAILAVATAFTLEQPDIETLQAAATLAAQARAREENASMVGTRGSPPQPCCGMIS